MDGTQTETSGAHHASTGDLLQRLANGVPALFRKETQLLKTEINEAGTNVLAGLGLIIGAVVFSLVALNVLAGALVKAIVNAGLGAGWAALIVGGLFALIAVAMGLAGQNQVKSAKLAPTRTARSLDEDAQTVKEATR